MIEFEMAARNGGHFLWRQAARVALSAFASFAPTIMPRSAVEMLLASRQITGRRAARQI